ncbi:MAG: hypothetical protein EZS28_002926 [Streblomastix strix]|uniref:Uncharacterized protein n=1 Tax=Streblomastix strix TaxID=222440 RepID=A0A5J4X4E7_9EUKA|nr:MAG: hypothetical protein EZS28_002926 [Streblomastix strix]
MKAVKRKREFEDIIHQLKRFRITEEEFLTKMFWIQGRKGTGKFEFSLDAASILKRDSELRHGFVQKNGGVSGDELPDMMILSDIEEQEQQVQNLMIRIIRGPVKINDERGRYELHPRIIVVTSQQTPDEYLKSYNKCRINQIIFAEPLEAYGTNSNISKDRNIQITSKLILESIEKMNII